ncbi:MAG: Bacillopeptidase [Gammaproteobacteria bacterium]|nr:Bacillopeptidase [Gammaproteobacteria bacterium]
MKDSIPFSLRMWVAALIGLSAASGAIPNPVTPAQAKQVEQSDVIVILRDQVASVPPARRAMGSRAAAVAAAQSPVVTQLQQTQPRHVTSFTTINAFATKVSPTEAAQLSTHPLVQAVVPDRAIHAQNHRESIKSAGANSTGAANSSGELCGTLEPEALQLTHTAFLSSATAQAQTVIDGNGKAVTGKGVKVAFLADGLDPNIAGFIRADGSHVFIDYQDFSGDPAGTPTPGGEAFGDASSIAAQDNPHGKPLSFDIGKFVNAAHPLPSPCAIHIRGMAPDASLVGLKVFSNLGYTTTSAFVQAIEYAVAHDDVDVINESFGGNPYPDQSTDPISMANAAAVKAGVTVTVSSGDAGTAGTIGSPATDPNVISVGASTQFRLYAQTGYGVQALARGYSSNNISALSSGGIAQFAPRTVDVVAPGDLGWALCSTNTALYTDCIDFESNANPSPIQDFGGTSESAPLTAGEAALVIQAYRSTHQGKDPSPALVKKIIMSTATDLGAPTREQGAGLINSLAAVNVALSTGSADDGRSDGNGNRNHDDHNRDGKAGAGLLIDSTGVSIVGAPNARESRTLKITNTGSMARRLTPALQTLGAPIAGATFNLTLAPGSDPTFINPNGAPRAYIKQKFIVPPGAAHLDAAIAYQVSLSSPATPIAYISLLDPSGRQAAYSIPQGLASGYGHVDIVKPAAGAWTAVIWTRPAKTTGSYSGPVQFTWAAEQFVKVGSVYPATLELEPGATQSLSADFFMPTEPGDLAAGIRFTEAARHDDDAAQDGGAGLPEVPVLLRTLIPTGPTGGSFTGTLTGGNGRPGAGPTQTFEFDVPQGVKDMSLALQIADNGYLIEGLLVDPQGMQLSVELNVDPFGDPQYGLQHFHYDPQPGRWKFILVQDFTSSGNQTSLPFTARIGFNTARISAGGLPNDPSKTLSASGNPLTFTISVVNTGAVTEAYFADARSSALGVAALRSQPVCAATSLPGACDGFYVPTQATGVEFVAQSTVPIQMDAYNSVGYYVGGTGTPDLFAKKLGTDSVAASLFEPEIPYGAWIVSPALIGPFGASGAPAKAVSMSAFALLHPFDPAFTADSGDIWADYTLGTKTFNPLVLASGAAGTINVTIAPDASQVGATVSGYVYVDTFNPFVGTGDEVVRIPYSYTVAP